MQRGFVFVMGISTIRSWPHTLRALQRKKTLLVEYRQLKKSNVFVDRRFGGMPLHRFRVWSFASEAVAAVR